MLAQEHFCHTRTRDIVICLSLNVSAKRLEADFRVWLEPPGPICFYRQKFRTPIHSRTVQRVAPQRSDIKIHAVFSGNSMHLNLRYVRVHALAAGCLFVHGELQGPEPGKAVDEVRGSGALARRLSSLQ